jgi:uncharacterized surface protein with fasciclin (FAS1) repeats
MKNMKALIIAVLFGTLLITNNSYAAEGLEEKDGDIVDVAVSTKFLSTLVEAVKAGDLVGTLKGDGPYTVFAPTNEAFAALPEGTLEALLMPKNRDKLVEILTYHVVAGKVLSSDLSDGMKAKTVEGSDITVHVSDSGVKINEANVSAADIMASNGVVHVIDRVIIPPME